MGCLARYVRGVLLGECDMGRFWRDYERYLVGVLVKLHGFFGSLQESDFERVYYNSIYFQKRLMTLDEFVVVFRCLVGVKIGRPEASGLPVLT